MRFIIMLSALLFGACAHLHEAEEPAELRILAYNIHHGAGLDGKLDIERIAQVIRSVEPDLVAVQEVDYRTARVGGMDQPTELARLTGMYVAFGKALDYQGGEYGQVILSKWPIENPTVHMLPQRVGREPRIALAGKIARAGGELIFASTHLDHEIEEIRIEQAQKLNEIFAREPVVILAGDLNAIPESRTMQALFPKWLDAAEDNPQPTIPAESPLRRIDYILLRPKHSWKVVESRVLDESVASDHRPVFAIVRQQ